MHAPRSFLLLLGLAVAACPSAPPGDPPLEGAAVERVGQSRAAPRWNHYVTACELPEGLEDLSVPPVDMDDPESWFSEDSLPLIDIRFSPGGWEQACEDAQRVADWMEARREGEHAPPIQRPQVKVDVFIQDRALFDVGFRFRGQSNLYAMFYDRWSRPIRGALEACKADRLRKKPSYRITIDAFIDGRTVAGQRAIDLAGREGSEGAYLREVTAQHVARNFDLPAPRVSHARVCRDGVYDGIFTMPEEVDAPAILGQLFPGKDTGDYWEVVGPAPQVWGEGWTEQVGWQSSYEPIGDTPDSLGRLAELLDAGTAIAAGQDPGSLSDLIHVEGWLRNMALDMVIPDYDGMMGNHKNHAWYDHPDKGLLPISFDKDLAFVDLGSYLHGNCAGSIWGGNPCWSSRRTPPVVAGHLLATRSEAYLALIEELLAGPLHPDTLLPWIAARADAIRPWVAGDRYYQPGGPACEYDPLHCSYYTLGAWEYEAGPLLASDILERRAEVQRQLAGEFRCEQSCREGPFLGLSDGD